MRGPADWSSGEVPNHKAFARTVEPIRVAFPAGRSHQRPFGGMRSRPQPRLLGLERTMIKTRGLRWYILVLVGLGGVVNYIDRNTLAVLAPALEKILHFS